MRTPLKRYLTALTLFSLLACALPAAAYGQARSAAAAIAPQPATYEKALSAIETKLDARRQELGIPGVSLVIVKDDQIIYMKGLGYKDFEKKIVVTPDTQFAIGSATKAFT